MNGDDDWSSKRLETTYEEARTVLDAQQATLSDIDDKAMRTVRITALILSVLVSLARFAAEVLNQYAAGIGGAFLLFSIIMGVETYNESDIFLGANRSYIAQLVDDDFQATSWEEDLLQTYGGFIEENSTEIEANSSLFRGQQICFLLGLLFLGLAVVI